MKLINTNPKFKSLLDNSASEITINNEVYKILTFFEYKHNPEDTVPLAWSNITELVYIDDISMVGLTGKMVLSNQAGIYDKVLGMVKDIYLGVYLYNVTIGFEENIYFSIVDSYALEETRSSSGISYLLKLQEAFISEAMSRNFATMDLGITGESVTLKSVANSILMRLGLSTKVTEMISGKNIYEFIEYVVKLISTDISINANTGDSVSADSLTLTESENTKRVLDLDTESMEYFRTNYPTEGIGEAIYQNINSNDSCANILASINKNFVTQSNAVDTGVIDATLQGELVSCRSENISNIVRPGVLTTDKTGERKLTLRNYRDTFTECFQNNTVYEILTSLTDFKAYKTDKKYAFISGLVPTANMVKKYPLNLDLIASEWCDYIVVPSNEPDSFTGILYKFTDILDYFNKNYLFEKEKHNINFNSEQSNSIAKKEPIFGLSEMLHSTFAKTIESFFTLNSMIEVTLPGSIHRKANELIFIEDSLMQSSKDLDSAQTSLDNMFTSNYYFVTRAVHSFKGMQYSNQLFLCAFSNK